MYHEYFGILPDSCDTHSVPVIAQQVLDAPTIKDVGCRGKRSQYQNVSATLPKSLVDASIPSDNAFEAISIVPGLGPGL